MPRFLVGIDLGTTNMRAGLRRPAEKTGRGGPKLHHVPRPAARRAGRGAGTAAAAVVPLPARPARPAGRGHRPCRGTTNATDAVGEFARNHGAKVPGPAGHVGEVVAVPPRRRSHRAAAAVGRAAGRAAALAARSLGAVPAAPRRGVEPGAEPQARGPARRAAGRPHGAGVVRRRGPQPDRRGREAGRA